MEAGKAKPTAKKPHYFVGIDPGKNGGIAVLSLGERGGGNGGAPAGGLKVADLASMPADYHDLYDVIKFVAYKFERVGPGFVYLEKVGGYRKGSRGNIGSAMFKFGENYGAVKMALVANGLGQLYKAVAPVTWQSAVMLDTNNPLPIDVIAAPTATAYSLSFPQKKGSGQWKNFLKERAQELFPGVKVTLKTADALLLAYYCYLKKGR